MNPFEGVSFGLPATPLYILVGLAFLSGIIGWLLTIALPRAIGLYAAIGLFLVSFYYWIKFL